MRIYIDTSVINGLYVTDLEIKAASIEFFNFVQRSGSVIYSADLTVEEIERTPQDDKRNKLKKALEQYEVDFLPLTDEIHKMAGFYVAEKIIPEKYLPDAIHIATATIYNIPILVSWNFEHIVKLKTKNEINRVNRQLGYPQISISSPKEV